MKKRIRIWFYTSLLIFSLLNAACSLPSFTTRKKATPTPIPPTPTQTATVTQTPIPTETPTPVPTPTPLPGVSIVNGDQALFNGDWDRALSAFQEAYRLSGDDVETLTAAQLGIGRVYYESGDYPTALNTLRDLVDHYPDASRSAEAYFFLGQIYMALDRYSEAADAYLNYLVRRHGSIDAYIYELRGDALFAAGDYPSAMNDYQAAYQSPRLGSTFSLEIKMARVYAITGDITTAGVMYQDIYNRTDDIYTKAQVDLLAGQAYMASNQPEAAYEAYLDAVQNFPQAYDAYSALVELVNANVAVDEYQRGLVDYYAGEYTVAIQAFDRYLSGAPANPAAAYYYKGQALNNLGNSSAAVDTWDIVIQKYPTSAQWDEAWEMKAYIQWAYLDDYTGAEKTLLDFVAAAPSHARASEFLFDAGRVDERAGRLADAATIWKRVADEYPLQGYAYRALFLAGICYYRIGDYAAAQTTFTDAHKFVPTIAESAAVHLWIGKAQKAAGDDIGARLTWQKAMTIDPTGYYSERARDLVANHSPFTPPQNLDLGYNLDAERAEAETWLRATFALSPETDLSGPGALTIDPRFQRGEEFWRLGLYEQARDEFESLRQAVELNAADTYRLMNYFNSIGLYRSAILASRQVLVLAGMDDAASLTAPVYFNHIRFGTYYADLVLPLSQSYNVNPLLVWSMMRQESFFEGFIRSSAGARGLMQIMPATGQSIADQVGWPVNFTPDDLYRPAVSINLGIEYLDQQRTSLGDLYPALAAYNAGPGNAANWKGLALSDPDLYLEVIRLSEPQRYIKSIYEMYAIYKQLYDRTP
jgi:soluble lytic murein transglycosylase